MVIFDNHLHLRRDGLFLDAVKEFKQAGGTHFVLCQYPMPSLVVTEKSYKTSYEQTLRLAEEVRSAVDVGVFVTVGPYPVDYLVLAEKLGRSQAIEIMRKGIDLAAELCQQQLCVAIGEIGRPHFPVDETIFEDSTMLLQYGMEKAKDVGVPVVVHAESMTLQQCKELVEMGRRVGLPADKVVRHFCPPLVTSDENCGLMPSVLASQNNIVNALSKSSRFMMETDYIDDLRRPGAVLGPKTVPMVTRRLIDRGIMSFDDATKIHCEWPMKTYNIELGL